MLKNIVEFIVKELVQNDSGVRVTETLEDKKIVLTIQVDEQDFGKVIGKGGSTIRAIRSLISSLNTDKDRQVVVDISK